jgi:L-fuculose-phosphate aldolase
VLDESVITEWLRYASMVTRRGYVSSQLGNIALRVPHEQFADHGVVYTKHVGVSLEEATRDNIIVTGVVSPELVHGHVGPSPGHRMNLRILEERRDVNAVIHLHIDEVLAYFMSTGLMHLPYLSCDTAIILGKPVKVLSPEINVEQDTRAVPSFIHDTNAFVMPNHGVTTVGRDVSMAYNRMNALVAEVRRLSYSMLLSGAAGRAVRHLSDREESELYELSSLIS